MKARKLWTDAIGVAAMIIGGSFYLVGAKSIIPFMFFRFSQWRK